MLGSKVPINLFKRVEAYDFVFLIFTKSASVEDYSNNPFFKLMREIQHAHGVP